MCGIGGSRPRKSSKLVTLYSVVGFVQSTWSQVGHDARCRDGDSSVATSRTQTALSQPNGGEGGMQHDDGERRAAYATICVVRLLFKTCRYA